MRFSIDEVSDIAFLVQSAQGHLHGHVGVFSMAGLARMHAVLHINTLCFVHFYSGYRRVGDLQYHIESHAIQGVYQIFCLSIDFCLHGETNDLASQRTRQFWTKQIPGGAVLGVGGGPPCETFTAARMLDGGPPVLRTFDEPLGIPHSSPKQWRQTILGTLVMQFLVEMAMLCARIGGCAFVEHPAFPVWALPRRPASTWSSKEMGWLRRLHCSSVVTFDQCLFGCEGRKPTTLLLVRLPGLRDQILQMARGGRCSHPPGAHEALQGRRADGSFKTSIAKVYPPALNAALAGAIIDFAVATFPIGHSTDPLPDALSSLLRWDFVSKDIVQADCHWAV
eukprot:s1179_g11.t1